MDLSSIVVLFVFGLIGGLLSGLLGVGGGIIFVPILTYFLKQMGVEDDELVKYVLANSLGTIFFAGIISSYKQFKLGQFFPKQIVLTASLAMVSSFIITHTIVNASWYSQKAFSFVFVGLLVFILFRFWIKRKGENVPIRTVQKYKFPLTGFFTGIVTALSGLGGGAVMIPIFTQFCKLSMRQAAAISIGVIPLIIIPVLISYASISPSQVVTDHQIGYILPYTILPIIGGLIFAAPFGVVLSHRLSNTVLKAIFASLILLVIINTLVNIIS